MSHSLYSCPELAQELPKQHDMDIRYCGVGKVNAAHATMKAIADGATKIVNFGTAGLVCAKELKGLLKVTHIKERDMQAEPQAPRGVTPFEETPFAGEIELSPLREITLGTGDSFVQAPDQWFDEAQIDIVDMEACTVLQKYVQKNRLTLNVISLLLTLQMKMQ